MTHEEVNQRYAEIQALLRDRLQAQGRGIIEMSRDVEPMLDRRTAWQIREVGRARNCVVHEALPASEIPAEFKSHCREIVAALRRISPQPARPEEAEFDYIRKPGVRVPIARTRRARRPEPPPVEKRFWRWDRCVGVLVGAAIAFLLGALGHLESQQEVAFFTVVGGVLGFFWLQSLLVLLAAGALYWVRRTYVH